MRRRWFAYKLSPLDRPKEKEKLRSRRGARRERELHGGKVSTREVNLVADWRWWRAVSDQSLCWSSHRHAWRLVIAAHHLSCRVVLSLCSLITMDPISYSSRAASAALLHSKTSSERSNFISNVRWNILYALLRRRWPKCITFARATVLALRLIRITTNGGCAVRQFVRRASYADLLLLINWAYRARGALCSRMPF